MAENSVVAFFEPNLLRKEAVLELMAQKKPIIKVVGDFNGEEKEIALYVAMEWDEANGRFSDTPKINKAGNKFLNGKIKTPDPKYSQNSGEQQTQNTASTEIHDEIPF
tara:strand:+ start:349 stop:672 length:324 start_codon:yes stop_codon:yes gene_type:complete